MSVTYIKVFVDWLDAIEPLGDAERGRLFTSLLEYARTGAVPQLNGNERFIFPMMRAQVARDIAQMEATSENRGKRKKANEDLSNLSDKSNLSGKRTQDKDKDKDKEEEEDKDKEGSPPTPFTGKLQVAFEDWVSYKKERRDPYKETGLKNLIGQIRNAADQYGDNAVEGIIRESMASGYKGIMFDRLKKQAVTTQRKKTFSELVAEMGGGET